MAYLAWVIWTDYISPSLHIIILLLVIIIIIFYFFKGKVGATFELLLIIYIFLFFSLYLELAGHNMDKTDCSTEGPLLSEGRGYPSEQTFHQDSFRVKRQTPHMEVVSGITSFLVNVCVFSFVLFKAVCHCCSIRGMYGVKEGK